LATHTRTHTHATHTMTPNPTRTGAAAQVRGDMQRKVADPFNKLPGRLI